MPPQTELFVPACQLVQPATSSFYSKLEATLDSFGFADQVRQFCAPAYAAGVRGRPGIDPVVYLKMLMVGFFENIASERAIAERCQDSISLRAFLGYTLTQSTPDHSSLSVIRSRLGPEIYDQVFLLILKALQEHGLVKGRHVGIDASVIEANASLKSLVNRQTEEAYWEYVSRLASENGVNPKDAEAVRQFDRKRPKKMSNQDWENPHDPDAKIGRTKAGATDMIYKPENTVDLDTGAILRAEVRAGHEPDAKDLASHVLEAQEIVNEVKELPPGSLTIESVTADKGYHAIPEMGPLQAEGIRTVIPDLVKNRKTENLTPGEAKVVGKAKRSAQSKSGKVLLKKRGMHIERTFAHMLDAGGARRTTLRGLENLNKRFKVTAAIYNLSQLMRKLLGIGTPRQWAAGAKGLVWFLWRVLAGGGSRMAGVKDRILAKVESRREKLWRISGGRVEDRVGAFLDAPSPVFKCWHSSTGCQEVAQPDDLVAPNPGSRLHRARFQPVELKMFFGARDIKGRSQNKAVKAPEIDIAPIHDIEGPRLQNQFVQDAHIGHFSIGNRDKHGDGASQVQERVQLDGGFGAAETRPGKELEAKVNGGGIQGVNRLVQFHADVLFAIEQAGSLDESLGQVMIDAPVAVLVGVGEGAVRNPAPDSQMVELILARAQAGFYVVQALSVSHLAEGHAEKLVPTGEGFKLIASGIAANTALELLDMNEIHKL